MRHNRFETMESEDWSDECPYRFHCTVTLKTKKDRTLLKKIIKQILQGNDK